jgi:phage regulator Rha-like protein
MHEIATLINGQQATMSSREIAELVESRHDSVKRTIERCAESGAISHPPLVDGMKAPNGVVEKLYQLDKRSSLIVVAQLSPTFTARVVDRWQELEDAARPKPSALTRMEILQIALDSEKECLRLAEERDHAIATKSQISTRREAQAMAAASVACREVTKLKIELDQATSYATVKLMEAAFPGRRFDWRELVAEAERLGRKPVKVPDVNYDIVNSYHKDVWSGVYGISIPIYSQKH